MNADTYSYSYDDIGNRKWATADAAVSTYAANQLNQYTVVTNSGMNNAVVHDADGNMTRNGSWYYAWDGENNMRRAGVLGMSNGIIRVDNGYDYMKRRVAKTVTVLTGYIPFTGFGQPFSPGEWVPVRTTRFIWDNWNIAAEITVDHGAGTTNVTRYVWGLDLSGSVQGAGGVGGLLVVIEGDGSVYFPCYDANGNITEYVDESGTIVTHYAYSAFGEITAQTGVMADAFKHRFSTKPFDAETGHYKYQQRDYIPPLARWASFDPINEDGGANLYGFVRNSAIINIDPLGQMSMPFDYSAIESHFEALKEQLKNELRDLCPKEGVIKWKRPDRRNETCCQAKNCRSQADALASAYIDAIRKVWLAEYQKYGVVLGGILGNIRVYMADQSKGYGDDSPDDWKDGNGLKCGGWAGLGSKVYNENAEGSDCWLGTEKIRPGWFVDHAYFILTAPKGERILDPWKSGGYNY